MQDETFKPVKGYEDLYEISNYGKIKSLNKEWKVLNYKSKEYTSVKMKSKILKTSISHCGYEQIVLSKNGKATLKLVHRLVTEAFIPNPENLPCVNHKNGNKSDNYVENLEWCTYSYNEKHAFKIGLSRSYLKGKYGKEHNLAKSIEQYDLQGNFIKTWDCISDAARELKIDNGRITKCCQHRKYCHSAGGFKWEYSKKVY